ncbi:Uncharacterised protein [Escherichia coli]|uniref:Uncharacterized protein n=1 Tax=Escherichia phage SP27 TaxID=2495557 RepID=A0A5A4U2A4_9CAUD|nr:hypothetical protein [Escherichia coli]WPK20074.1 hypothetical protein [Salmonella phage SD-1_S14]BBM61615.1 hypothetical protein EO157G_0260 [Escherichia phage SP27]VVZ28538.1 Uncharacterised protein [Escherichia coli]VVZ36906.1 Uncharacterised protein [Escherichia coli]VWN21201.1 Uncharacterised protein [Escherichia coli]
MNYEYDQQSVNQMADLLSGLNDIEAGETHNASGVPYKTGGDIGAMASILTSLNEAGMDYGEPQHPHMVQYNSPYNEHLSGNSPVPSPRPSQAPIKPKTNWSLVEEKVQGTKSTKVYSIKCNHSSQIIMNNIMMYEAALTLVNLLNEGRMLTDAKVLGIISSGLQYTNVISEALKAAQKRQRVLNESKYDEAKDLDIIIAEKKAEAYKLKERVLNFLKSEGYIK